MTVARKSRKEGRRPRTTRSKEVVRHYPRDITEAVLRRQIKAEVQAHMQEVDEWAMAPDFTTKIISATEVNGRLMVKRLTRSGHETVVLL